MAITVDALTLNVQTSADSAATSVDRLISKLGELKTLLETGFAVEFGKNIQRSVSAAMQNVEKTVVGSMKKAATDAVKAFKPKASILSEFKSSDARKAFNPNEGYGPSKSEWQRITLAKTRAEIRARIKQLDEQDASREAHLAKQKAWAENYVRQNTVGENNLRLAINTHTGVNRGRTKRAERSAYAMDAEMQKREWQSLSEFEKDAIIENRKYMSKEEYEALKDDFSRTWSANHPNAQFGLHVEVDKDGNLTPYSRELVDNIETKKREHEETRQRTAEARARIAAEQEAKAAEEKARVAEREALMSKTMGAVSSGDTAALKQMKLESMGKKMADYANSENMDPAKLTDMAIQYQKLKSSIDAVNGTKEETKSFWERLKEGASSAKKVVKDYIKEHTKLIRQFGRVAKTRAMRAAIRAITSGLKEGIGNLYQYSKAIKGSFAQSMDNASTALLLMKNSIATAIAPVIQALVPVLQTVVGWIREACNWLSQFFAIMNGQSTWTRAVEYATEYAAETKKASDNTKSMLAAFDELNVIQSKSGSGSGNNNNMDYSKMFEEVNHFDSSIEDIAKKAKEVVGWISDNFMTILATVGLIKAAIAAWNISKELAGVMGTLGKWATGGLLITLGVVLSYDFGKKVGLGNKLNAGDIIEGIAGVAAAALGGFLIGGGVGAAIGVSIALIAGLVGYVNGQKEQLRNSRWGTETMTPEQVKEYVRKMYSFDVENEINLLSTARLNLESAKKSVDEKVIELEQSLRKITLGIEEPSSLAQRIKDTADAAVAEYETYSDLKSAYITVFPKSGLDETLNGSTGREMIEDAGELMGQILVDSAGRKLTAEESEMISRVGKWMHNVLTGADEYQRQLEHATDTRMNLSNFSRDTASEIFEAQKTMDQGFYNEALASQYALADESDRLANYNRSILSEGIDPKTGKQLTKQRIKDLTEEADELEKEAKLIRANAKAYAQGKLASAQNASKDIWADTFQDVYSKEMTEKWRMYGSFQDADRYNIKEYVKSGDTEKADALFEKGLGTLIKGIDPIAFDVSQYYNLTGWDVLSKDGRAMLVETMKDMLDSDATVQMLRDVCKIDVDDIMDVYGYDDLGNAEQRKFEHAMLKAYGAEAVATLQKKTKLDVLGIITTSGYEKLSKQERENFTTAMFKAYGYKDTITELKRYCKYDINDVISVSGYQSMTETERRKFVTNCVAAYGPSAVSEIKKNTKIKATELIDIGSWKEFTLEQKIDFIEAIADAYGSKEAVAAAKSAGVDIASLIGEGMESQDPAIRKKAADLRSSMEEVIAGKPIDVKVEPKTEKSVWQKALDDIKSFFKDPINAVVNWTTNLINGATGGSGSTFLNTLGNTLYNAGKTAAKNLGFNNSATIEPDASASALNDMVASTNKTVKDTLLDLPRTTQYPLFRQQFTVKTLSGKENSKTLKVFNMEKAEVEWLKKNGYKLNEVNYNYGQGKRQITQMYKGGYDIPAGDLFMANERGAELVGQIGNKTAVANQNQIITGISNGVQQAMRGVEARLSRIERNTGITADKDFSVKLTPSVGLGRVNAQSAAMYGGLTGK